MSALEFEPSQGVPFTVNSQEDLDDGVRDRSHCSLGDAINVAHTSPATSTSVCNGCFRPKSEEMRVTISSRGFMP